MAEVLFKHWGSRGRLYFCLRSIKGRNSVLFFLLGVFVCLQSCDEPANHEDDQIEGVDLIDFTKSMGGSLSSLIDEVKVIQLDTSETALLASPYEVFFDEGYVFILDALTSKSIYSYDSTGKFNYKISRYGRGPGEYTLLNTISTFNDKLVGWAAEKRKLLYFNKLTGEFLSEGIGPGSFFGLSISYTSKGELIMVNNGYEDSDNPDYLYVFNSDYSSKAFLDNTDESWDSGFLSPWSSLSKDKGTNALFKHPLKRILYEVVDGEIVPRYVLKVSESEFIAKEDLLLADEALALKAEHEGLYLQTYGTLNGSSYVSLGLAKGTGLGHGLLYSKRTRKTLDYSKIKNNVFDFELPIPIATYKDYMVFVIEPEEVEHLETVFKKGAEKFAVPNSSKTIRGNLALVLIKFKF